MLNYKEQIEKIASTKKTIVFDFDGVIHSYKSGWKGTTNIPDKPVEGIKEAIDKLRQDYNIVVVSTRCFQKGGIDAIKKWLEKYDIKVDGVVKEKPPAIMYVDDNAVCFDGNPKHLIEQIGKFNNWMNKEANMNYKEQIEKVAQSKWRKKIDSINNENEMYDTVADFNRNDKVYPSRTNPSGWSERELNGMDKTKIKQSLSKNIINQQRLSPQYQKIMNSPISSLSKEDFQRRHELAEDKNDEKKLLKKISDRNGNKSNSMSIETGFKDPEEYVDIVHGTNKSKAKAFIFNGNSPSKLESKAVLDNGKVSDMGIQVHSKNTERAPQYAKMQAEFRGGSPALIKGQVQRKYLYPNPSRSSGGGDEYGLPEQFANKIKNGRVEDLNGNVVSKMRENMLPYGRTKTPGSKPRLDYKEQIQKGAKKGIDTALSIGEQLKARRLAFKNLL